MCRSLIAFVLLFVVPIAALAEDAQKVGTTLENLQAAFDGESNAKARYDEFAKKADAEGYIKVASLFRAAAKAEEIHAKKHAEVIAKMGAKPTSNVVQPIIASTKENLEAALKGESYERDVMYPLFIKAAEQSGDKEAVRAFSWAMKAEAQHAKYYGDALSNLADWKSGSITFVVCPVCGFTSSDSTVKKCPVCSEPRKKFFEIN
ncbi:MAG: rubrerythrin [SAR324 cluster bacterium]|uniref:Rubrerythrin n=1 Tax=SAR324 cluster bacterium TaxID=2024889 RepID=A0A7X9FQH1_9DELT|nr:rubrerythrin [SAR324 cluster bacterium]